MNKVYLKRGMMTALGLCMLILAGVTGLWLPRAASNKANSTEEVQSSTVVAEENGTVAEVLPDNKPVTNDQMAANSGAAADNSNALIDDTIIIYEETKTPEASETVDTESAQSGNNYQPPLNWDTQGTYDELSQSGSSGQTSTVSITGDDDVIYIFEESR